MGNEGTIRSSLAIKQGKTDYSSQPTSFRVDVSEGSGPTPGAITVSIAGTDVDLSELATPGLCRIQNLDASNYVTYGIVDPETEKFYPLGELLAGESYVFRLARDIQEEYGTGAGTGTTGPDTNRLRIKAHTAACVVLVEAFGA